MRNLKNNSVRTLLILSFLCFSISISAQEKTVNEILKEAQEAMDKSRDLICKMSYNWYDTYTIKKPSLSYKGMLIKQESVIYSKIDQTFFITDEIAQVALKCNEKQKAFVVTKTNKNESQSPWDLLDVYIKQFKIKKVTDQGDYWICSLTTDVITQLPYGKVEIHIDKKSSLITKQVLYFLSQVPYTNAKGEKAMGNPKMEITLSNYKTVLNTEEKMTAKLATYIKKEGQYMKPVTAYEKFEVIQY